MFVQSERHQRRAVVAAGQGRDGGRGREGRTTELHGGGHPAGERVDRRCERVHVRLGVRVRLDHGRAQQDLQVVVGRRVGRVRLDAIAQVVPVRTQVLGGQRDRGGRRRVLDDLRRSRARRVHHAIDDHLSGTAAPVHVFALEGLQDRLVARSGRRRAELRLEVRERDGRHGHVGRAPVVDDRHQDDGADVRQNGGRGQRRPVRSRPPALEAARSWRRPLACVSSPLPLRPWPWPDPARPGAGASPPRPPWRRR